MSHNINLYGLTRATYKFSSIIKQQACLRSSTGQIPNLPRDGGGKWLRSVSKAAFITTCIGRCHAC